MNQSTHATGATRRVLISGAGIAGPTLAYWLLRRGFEPVIVERAPDFRAGGYIIDFWGVGFDVAEKMGLVPKLRALGYANDRIAFVERSGRLRSQFGGDALRRSLRDRYFSILRGDLAHAIYETVCGRIETIFGDEVAAIDESNGHALVRFKSGRTGPFDLVIGADGLHSAVRGAVFDPGDRRQRYLGYHAAVFITRGYSRRRERTYLSYAAPGRQISRFALRDDQTGFLFVFASPARDAALLREISLQKRVLRDTFSVDAWVEWPEIERHLEACQDLYFDAVTQVELPAWSKGRVALVGDAAYCPSLLAGEGSAFAMAGAYILAGELGRTADHAQAFAAYERQFRPFIERKQKAARGFASGFAPSTAFGLFVRDVVLQLGSIPTIGDFLMRRFVTDAFSLPEYEATLEG